MFASWLILYALRALKEPFITNTLSCDATAFEEKVRQRVNFIGKQDSSRDANSILFLIKI